tara:strand:- start:4501 stop:4983 length:483 start_codon:yes stop_codon:yes gene_type:complete
MENITSFMDITDGSMDGSAGFDCEDLTNNGLYMIFIGYLYPMLSPTIRAYMKDMLVSIKNVGKVTGQVVSLTEFGFTKLQDIKSNKDMVDFISRVCKNKDLNVFKNQIIDCAWSFSGDTDNGKKENMEQSWKKLLNELDKFHALNIMNRTTNHSPEKLRP